MGSQRDVKEICFGEEMNGKMEKSRAPSQNAKPPRCRRPKVAE